MVAPSGSCAGMIKVHYPALFADEPDDAGAARKDLAARTYELVSFLTDVMKLERVAARYRRRRHLSRFLLGPARAGRQGAAAQAARQRRGLDADGNARRRDLLRLRRHVLRQISGDISDKIVADKAADIEATGADTLLAGDLGCLLNMAGKLTRRGRKTMRVRMSPRCWPA